MRRPLTLLVACLACGGGGTEPRPLVLASTTSIEETGLIDALVPRFEREHPEVAVRVVAVGTGQALALGRRRDADVVLVHDSAAEAAFVAAGHGARRREVMVNDFIVVGPPEDPARIRGADARAAFARIRETGARFVSRGDDSGTHLRERELWRAAGSAPPDGTAPFYREAGLGMSETLTLADETAAYTLTDRATYTTLRHALRLIPLVEGDPALLNPYAVIEVVGATNAAGARAFADWLTSLEGQAAIARFGRERFGEPLFRPSAAGR